jgi:hypothetical protein
MRPGGGPPVAVAGLGTGVIAAILLAAAGAVGVAVFRERDREILKSIRHQLLLLVRIDNFKSFPF